MKIFLKLIHLYFSLWSSLLGFVFSKLTGVLRILPCCKEQQKTEPIPPKKPVYIKIIEECVEKLPIIIRALVEEILKKILPSFLKDHILPAEPKTPTPKETLTPDPGTKENTGTPSSKRKPAVPEKRFVIVTSPSSDTEEGTTEVILVPEKPIFPTPSQIFWEFHKDKHWIKDLYRSTSGSIFLSANEASLNLQEYFQSRKSHNLLIFHFENGLNINNNNKDILSQHKASDGSPIKFPTSYEYLCISLPMDQNNKFYESFDLDIFPASQLKCLATPQGIDLDCRNGFKNFKLEEGFMGSPQQVNTPPVVMKEEILEETLHVKNNEKRNFDAMVTSTDSVESYSSSNQEFSKESRNGSFRKRRNRKKNHASSVTEKKEKDVVNNGNV